MTYNCGLPEPEPTPPKFEPEEASDAAKRAARETKIVADLSNISPDNAAALAKLEAMNQQLEFVGRLSDIEALAPNQSIRSIGYQALKLLGLEENLIGALTNPAKVRRQLLVETRQNIAKIVGEMEGIRRAHAANRATKHLKEKYKITDRQWAAAQDSSFHLGVLKYAQGEVDPASNTAKYIAKKAEQTRQMLLDMGMSGREAKLFMNEGAAVAASIYESIAIIKAAGFSGSDLLNNGYLSSFFSEDALKVVKEIDGSEVKFSNGTTKSKAQAVYDSLNSWDFIAEDVVHLDAVLSAADPDIYTKLGVAGVEELLDDTGKLGQAILNHLNPKQLEYLSESGLLNKLPMNSTQVLEEVAKRSKFPFGGVDRLVTTDWDRAVSLYQQQLIDLVSDNIVAARLVDGATSGKWGAAGDVVRANPGKYGNYVKLGEAFPEEVMARLGIDDPQILNALSDTYVHKITADLINSEMRLATNPQWLSVLSRATSQMMSVFSVSALLSPTYMGKNLVEAATRVLAAGGSVATYGTYMAKATYAKVRGLNFIDVLDDTKILGSSGLTEKQLYQLLLDTNELSDVSILTGKRVKGIKRSDVVYGLQALTYELIAHGPMAFAGRVGKASDQMLSSLLSTLAIPLSITNILGDNLGKFAAIKDNLASGKFAGWDDALQRNIDDYFLYSPRKASGQLDSLGAASMPFYRYRKNNMLTSLKFWARHPSWFTAYERAKRNLNRDAEDAGSNFPIGGVPEYLLNATNFFIKGDKDTEWTAVQPGKSSGFIGAIDEFDALMKLLSSPFKDEPLKDDQLPIGKDFEPEYQRVVRELVAAGHPLPKIIYSLQTGKEPRTGRDYPKDMYMPYLGVEMPIPVVIAIEQLFPAADRIQDWNPGEIFGIKPWIDPMSGETVEGKPSAFGYEPSASQYKARQEAKKSPMELAGNIAGVVTTKVDTVEGMSFTFNEKRSLYFASLDEYESLEIRIMKAQSSRERAKLVQKQKAVAQTFKILRYELEEMIDWFEGQGAQNPQETRKLLNRYYRDKN